MTYKPQTLFENIDYRSDPEWIVKVYFNQLYEQGRFLYGLSLFVKKWGYCLNYDCCDFPDFIDSDPAGHFIGVKVSILHDEILLTEEAFSDYLVLACNRYVTLRPADKISVADLISQSDWL